MLSPLDLTECAPAADDLELYVGASECHLCCHPVSTVTSGVENLPEI